MLVYNFLYVINVYIILDYRQFIFSLLEHHRLLARFHTAQLNLDDAMHELVQFLTGLYHGLRFTRINSDGQPDASMKGPVSPFGGVLDQLSKDQCKFMRQMVEGVGGSANIVVQPTFKNLWCPAVSDIREAVSDLPEPPNTGDMSWMQAEDMHGEDVDVVTQLRRVSDFSGQNQQPVYRTERMEQMEFDAAVAASMEHTVLKHAAESPSRSVVPCMESVGHHSVLESSTLNEDLPAELPVTTNDYLSNMHEPTTSSAIVANDPPTNKRDASKDSITDAQAPKMKHPRTQSCQSRFGSMDRISPIRHAAAGRIGSVIPAITDLDEIQTCMSRTYGSVYRATTPPPLQLLGNPFTLVNAFPSTSDVIPANVARGTTDGASNVPGLHDHGYVPSQIIKSKPKRTLSQSCMVAPKLTSVADGYVPRPSGVASWTTGRMSVQPIIDLSVDSLDNDVPTVVGLPPAGEIFLTYKKVDTYF